MIRHALKKLKEWLIAPELEIILHPSRRRLQWLGVFTLLGHLVCWWLWTEVMPQAFEDGRVRLAIAITGIGLIWQPTRDAYNSQSMRTYFSVVCWLQLPFFFIWMYCMNGASAMWMATVAVMIVVYYHLTDWRLATLGLMVGAAAANMLAYLTRGAAFTLPLEHAVTFLFAWASAALLALSSANLRRERLRNSLQVIGIMAHELRTPVATMALIAQAIRGESVATDALHTKRLDGLATRVDALTRAINHHIDLQMANARYSYLPSQSESISAYELVRKAVEDYPFGSRRESQCVQILLYSDFSFMGSSRQFTQVINNILKNALFSLKSAQSRYDSGDLCIEIGARDGRGRIQFKDRGVGMGASQLKLIFEPFYSHANETGHGLGLAFCKQVVEAAQGTIMVHAEHAMGATFTVQLPCQQVTSEEKKRSHHEVSPLSPA